MELKKILSKIKLISFLLRTLIKYLIKGPRRYLNLFFIIIIKQPKAILEIGVYRGRRSIEMIKIAKIFNENISYYGFDLFEDFYNETDILSKELSKLPESIQNIKKKIDLVSENKLFKGYTNVTLPKFVEQFNNLKIDFVFIDGGHSIETIKNDWINIEKVIHTNSVVIFDDYYLENDNIIKKYGCNFIYNDTKISKIYKMKLLPLKDCFENSEDTKCIKMLLLQKK